MKFLLGSYFDEVDVNFQVSHKIYDYIRELLNSELTFIGGFSEFKDFKYVDLCVCANNENDEIDVVGPDYQDDLISWKLLLPYKVIVKDKTTKLDSFIECFFKSLIIILEKYKVKEELFRLKKKVDKQVLDNSEYLFEDLDPTPDVDIDEILGRK